MTGMEQAERNSSIRYASDIAAAVGRKRSVVERVHSVINQPLTNTGSEIMVHDGSVDMTVFTEMTR